MLKLMVLAAAAVLLMSCEHGDDDPYCGATECLGEATGVLGQIQHRIIVIGDAGTLERGGNPTVGKLRDFVNREEHPEHQTVLFLGDNIYESGLPPLNPADRCGAKLRQEGPPPRTGTGRCKAEDIIDFQINMGSAQAVFVAGNHDWAHKDGEPLRARRLEQERYVVRETNNPESFLPRGGCPGPVVKSLVGPGGRVAAHLILLDTQWFLAKTGRGCETDNSLEKSAERLKVLLAKYKDDPIIIASHHPLKSRGKHGGFFRLRDHMFFLGWLCRETINNDYCKIANFIPTPLIGTLSLEIYDLISSQNLAHSGYSAMRNALSPVVRAGKKDRKAPLFYAAGHDHSLQIFEEKPESGNESSLVYLVSGLGSANKSTPVGDDEDTIFAHSGPDHAGFMVIDILAGGGIRLSVYETKRINPVFQKLFK